MGALRRLLARRLLALAAWLDPGRALAAGPDDALAALRRRYPDAPEAWLRLIAARLGPESRHDSLRVPPPPAAPPAPAAAPATDRPAASVAGRPPAAAKANPPAQAKRAVEPSLVLTAPRRAAEGRRQPPRPAPSWPQPEPNASGPQEAPHPHLHFTASAGRARPSFGPASVPPGRASRPVHIGAEARAAGDDTKAVSHALSARDKETRAPPATFPAQPVLRAGPEPSFAQAAPATVPQVRFSPTSNAIPDAATPPTFPDAPAPPAAPAPVYAPLARKADPPPLWPALPRVPPAHAPQAEFDRPPPACWPDLPPTGDIAPDQNTHVPMPARWAAPRPDQEGRHWNA